MTYKKDDSVFIISKIKKNLEKVLWQLVELVDCERRKIKLLLTMGSCETTYTLRSQQVVFIKKVEKNNISMKNA